MEYLNDFRPELSSEEYSFTRKIFTDVETDKRVHRHLSVENDQITDKDLENIKTHMTPAAEAEEINEGRKQGFSEEELDA